MANEIDINIGTFDLDSTNNVSISDVAFNIMKTVQEYALPKFHGSVIPIGKRRAISIRVQGAVTGSDYDDLRTKLDALKNAIDDTSEKKFTLDDDRQVFVQYKSFGYSYKTLRRFIDFQVEFIASDPFIYSQALNSDSRTPTSGVGYTIANAGNAPTRVKITVTAGGSAISDDVKVQNTTTGETFQYRGSIASGEALVVNNRVDDPDLSVENDVDDDIANFEGDFITLNPGNNTIVFTSGASGHTVELEWRDAYK